MVETEEQETVQMEPVVAEAQEMQVEAPMVLQHQQELEEQVHPMYILIKVVPELQMLQLLLLPVLQEMLQVEVAEGQDLFYY